MTKQELPEIYTPFPTLIICSNELVSVQVPIAVGDRPVLLIGMDDSSTAQVWLQAPMGSPKGSTWEWIIEGNEKRFQDASVLIAGPSIGVFLGEDSLLHVTVTEPHNRADVISMDLRPLGMAIYGNMQGLTVAGNKLVGNHFNNVHTMISID